MQIKIAQIRNSIWLEMTAVYLLFRLLIWPGPAEFFSLTRKGGHFLPGNFSPAMGNFSPKMLDFPPEMHNFPPPVITTAAAVVKDSYLIIKLIKESKTKESLTAAATTTNKLEDFSPGQKLGVWAASKAAGLPRSPRPGQLARRETLTPAHLTASYPSLKSQGQGDRPGWLAQPGIELALALQRQPPPGLAHSIAGIFVIPFMIALLIAGMIA